ncbi:hypothetical protein [Maritimibacter dapengensis]|uniref:SPW repeat-containing protein n=1 Tax=Maritimibacter dapengensis TaxID=2836868 RepID=A0ABS6T596_9RHOB|nr:hypothetical protein [Maritimibacter dapengensis]MBV7380395.1 hypothetical protein [Maritimibacter dapengensis]
MAYRSGLIILALAAAVAFAAGLYGYFAPLTGVTGVWGPLLAAFGAFCIAVGALWSLGAGSVAGRAALLLLVALAIVLTLFAAILLHQEVMVVALTVAAICWFVVVAAPKGADA